MDTESNFIINSSDIDKYKICRYKFSKECMGITLKTLFHGSMCYKCYGFKRSEENRKKSELIEPSQLKKISEILKPEQMKKLIKLLNIPKEKLSTATELKLNIINEKQITENNDHDCIKHSCCGYTINNNLNCILECSSDKLNNISKHSTNNLNNASDNSTNNSNNTSNNSTNNSPNNSNKNSPNNSNKNSPKLQSHKGPTMKIIATH